MHTVDAAYYSAVDRGAEYCVCVCVCVYLSAIISSELHVRSSPNFILSTYLLIYLFTVPVQVYISLTRSQNY